MNYERIKKLESISYEIISKILLKESNYVETFFWMIFISKVEISPDLSYIDVWVSSLRNENILTKKLAKNNNRIQSEFNKKINIRKFPRIRYRYDSRWKNSQYTLWIISKL